MITYPNNPRELDEKKKGRKREGGNYKIFSQLLQNLYFKNPILSYIKTITI